MHTSIWFDTEWPNLAR